MSETLSVINQDSAQCKDSSATFPENRPQKIFSVICTLGR